MTTDAHVRDLLTDKLLALPPDAAAAIHRHIVHGEQSLDHIEGHVVFSVAGKPFLVVDEETAE